MLYVWCLKLWNCCTSCFELDECSKLARSKCESVSWPRNGKQTPLGFVCFLFPFWIWRMFKSFAQQVCGIVELLRLVLRTWRMVKAFAHQVCETVELLHSVFRIWWMLKALAQQVCETLELSQFVLRLWRMLNAFAQQVCETVKTVVPHSSNYMNA